jgi:hypothetical protein
VGLQFNRSIAYPLLVINIIDIGIILNIIRSRITIIMSTHMSSGQSHGQSHRRSRSHSHSHAMMDVNWLHSSAAAIRAVERQRSEQQTPERSNYYTELEHEGKYEYLALSFGS